ncbi:polynucleotide kinase [Vibrio phage D164]
MKRNCYVFDMDFTLADPSPRDHLRPTDPTRTENWHEWNKHAELDIPIQHTVNVLMSLYALGFDICIATVRGEHGFDYTQDWLRQRGIPGEKLYMRVEGDTRPAHEVKEEIFSEISDNHNILAAFDDDPKVVAHLRSLGYKMFNA